MTKIELSDGKYTVIHDNGRGLHALRYGEEWRNLAGDNLVMAMAYEIEELREENERINHVLDEIEREGQRLCEWGKDIDRYSVVGFGLSDQTIKGQHILEIVRQIKGGDSE